MTTNVNKRTNVDKRKTKTDAKAEEYQKKKRNEKKRNNTNTKRMLCVGGGWPKRTRASERATHKIKMLKQLTREMRVMRCVRVRMCWCVTVCTNVIDSCSPGCN